LLSLDEMLSRTRSLPFKLVTPNLFNYPMQRNFLSLPFGGRPTLGGKDISPRSAGFRKLWVHL